MDSLFKVDNDWVIPASSSPNSLSNPPGTVDSFRRNPVLEGLRKLYENLPQRSNHSLGLCESAWRMQKGQDHNALTLHTSPDPASNRMYNYYVCSQPDCYFKGRSKREHYTIRNVIDKTAIEFSSQVIYRWKFLMMNHVHKSMDQEVDKFGCVLCSSQPIVSVMATLPIFEGEVELLQHIQEMHVGEGKWPEETTMDRVGCVVCKRGSSGPEHDDWALLLLEEDNLHRTRPSHVSP